MEKIVLTLSLLACLSVVMSQTECSIPLGIANAYIVTSPPYTPGDLVTYRCYNGFVMSGTPSQTCTNTTTALVWVGTAPSCTAIDMSDTVNQNVNYTEPSYTMPDWAIVLICVVVGVVLLLLLLLAIAAICNMLGCRPCRRRSSVVVEAGQHVPTVRNSRHVISVTPTPEVQEKTPRLVSVVQEVMDYNAVKPAKEVKTWMPHANPVRPINTSTK